MPKRFKDGYEEASFMRNELRSMMANDPARQEVINYFVAAGIDRARAEILVSQAFKDREKQQTFLKKGKKFYFISLVFFALFAGGFIMWFYVWGDWITYFTGTNLVAFLFLLERGNALRTQAQIYEV
jgi:hypothetical protein